MIESAAWKALNLVDRKLLNRLEIEHLEHNLYENGRLKCTYDDFFKYGVRRGSIADSIRRIEALGFVEITERGRVAAMEFRIPSQYRLTYLPCGSGPPTDDWQKIRDKSHAKEVIHMVSTNRLTDKLRKTKGAKSSFPDADLHQEPGTDMEPIPGILGNKSGSTGPGANPDLLSISPRTHAQEQSSGASSGSPNKQAQTPPPIVPNFTPESRKESLEKLDWNAALAKARDLAALAGFVLDEEEIALLASQFQQGEISEQELRLDVMGQKSCHNACDHE